MCFRVICDGVMYRHLPWPQEKSDEHGDGASLPNMASGQLLISCLLVLACLTIRSGSAHCKEFWCPWNTINFMVNICHGIPCHLLGRGVTVRDVSNRYRLNAVFP